MRPVTSAVLIAALALGCDRPPTSIEPLGSVSGQVGFSGISLNVDARLAANGKPVGSIDWTVGANSTSITERVTCVEIDGNLAWIGTVVTAITGDPVNLPEGFPLTWIFRDGPDALQIDIRDGEPLNCKDKPPVDIFIGQPFFVPIESGDLTITDNRS